MTHPSTVSRNISPYTFETELTANDSSAKDMPGMIRTEWDSTYGLCKYVYVKNNSGTAFADGDAVVYNDSYLFKATGTHAAANRNRHCGVAFGAITASYYGWVQAFGYHDAIKVNSDGNIANGDHFVVGATKWVVQQSAAGTAATYRPMGIAVAADTTTSVEGRILVVSP